MDPPILGNESEGWTAYITGLLDTNFKLNAANIQQVEGCHYNHIFKIELAESTSVPQDSNCSRPGIVPVPVGTTNLILRIPNHEVELNHTVRIQNEVAMMMLMERALAQLPNSIVPKVYGWSPVGEDRGWILEQAMPGVRLDQEFWSLTPESQRIVLGQMAEILKALQDYPVPPDVESYGGASFDAQGSIVSGPMTLPVGGPAPSLAALYRSMATRQLELSDKSIVLDGWRQNGIRERLVKFVAQGLEESLSSCQLDRRVLVHGDFNLQNLLFDQGSLRITALLDFDFSHVANPISEIFHSFYDIHGFLPGPYARGPANLAIHKALLEGFPKALPYFPSSPVSLVKHGSGQHLDWALARMWADELERVEAERPKTISSASEVTALYWFIQDMCRFHFRVSSWVESQTKEVVDQAKQETEELMRKYLDRWGY